MMSNNGMVVAVYSDHAAAEDAVKQLWQSGYDIRKLSIVINDYYIEERVVGFYKVADRIKRWGKYGAVWGCIVGPLFGMVPFVLAGAGPEPMADPLAALIRALLAGAIGVGTLSAIAAGVYSLSLGNNSVLRYEPVIEAIDQFSLVTRGSADEAAAAKNIIRQSRPGAPDCRTSALAVPETTKGKEPRRNHAANSHPDASRAAAQASAEQARPAPNQDAGNDLAHHAIPQQGHRFLGARTKGPGAHRLTSTNGQHPG